MKNIWQEGYDNYKLDTLTDEAVEKAEEILKVKLPKSYINILKVQNGGYIKFNSYPCNVPTSWADNHINVEHILGIGEVLSQEEFFNSSWDNATIHYYNSFTSSR